jgi:hypothetical protein
MYSSIVPAAITCDYISSNVSDALWICGHAAVAINLFPFLLYNKEDSSHMQSSECLKSESTSMMHQDKRKASYWTNIGD